MSSQQRAWVIATLVILLVLVAMYVLWPSCRAVVNESVNVLMSGDFDRIEEWTAQFGVWGPIVVIVALMAQIFVLFIPSMPLIVASVLAFGPVFGAIYAFIGLMLASLAGYGVGRMFSPRHLERFVGKKRQKAIRSYIDDYGSLTVGVFRFSPILSADAVSIVSGLVRMRFWRYMLASAFGSLGLVVIVALLSGRSGFLLPGLVVLSVLSIFFYIASIAYIRRQKKTPAKSRRVKR